MVPLKAKPEILSEKDTQAFLTPFAFKVDESLFGIALATPWRRAAALLIDLLFVAIITGAPGELLATLVAITLFKVGSKKRAETFGKKASIRRFFLRIVGALMVFIVLLETLPVFISHIYDFNHQVEQVKKPFSSSDNNLDPIQKQNNRFTKGALSLAANIAISKSDCITYSCWQQLTSELLSTFVQQSTSTLENKQFTHFLLESVKENSTLDKVTTAKLTAQLQQLALLPNSLTVEDSLMAGELSKVEDTLATSVQDKNDSTTLAAKGSRDYNNDVSKNTNVYKGFAWLKGLIEEMGLGFGWAAFYFTMFTAIWHGQTPGKKLLSIRVIQLDGSPLSIWDSFGRYGGYGAGIATGLLGFAQIFWDPNRQAIHDKISSTVVISDSQLGKKK